ncbi:hypothetical protein [Bdellovibrio sp. HCB337]|uniref:hypothetical protein n=1 Tax=Bdellovibrio sp. HCB337 TaxID=3394358 RepID=UPI0039A6DA1D
MKFLTRSSLIFLLLSGSLALAVKGTATDGAAAPEKPAELGPVAEKVPVELEWEQIIGAKAYELEFQNQEGKVLNTFKSNNHIFKFKFKVGRYRVRSRVSDARKVYGEWSPLEEFTVQPKPAKIPKKNVVTTGVIDKKTLTSEVTFHWGEAAGASAFRVKVVNEKAEVIRDEIVKGFSYTTTLTAGTYSTTLTSIGNDGIESDPVTLAGRVIIETVQLDKPVIVFDEVADPGNPKVKIQRLPTTKGTPTLRWKDASKVADTVGTLEYRYFFGEEWIPVDKFTSKDAKEVILSKAAKPGRYRITAWAEAGGLKKSEATTYEFVIKPTGY